MIIPDINILIYAHDRGVPEHAAARNWWRRAVVGNETVGLPWVVALGFVRILSNPRVVRNPADPAELLEIVGEILSLPAVQVVAPGSRHVEIMTRLFRVSGGTGRLTTDVHLAALAIEHGAVLASNDADFSRFPALTRFNPLD